MRLIRTAIAVIGAAVLLFALALPVSANEITSLTADCGTGIIASGTHFEAVTVTLTGPGYSKSAAVQGDWTHTFPLGPNGSYSLDWPDSAEFGPVALTVRCIRGTEPPRRETPTPGRTLPPTSVGSRGEPDDGLREWFVFLAFGAALVVNVTAIVYYLRRRP